MIDFLKIKTLIITDLDYPKDALTDEVILASKSTNSTLNKFYKLSTGTADEFEEYNLEDDDNTGNNPTISELYSWRSSGKHEVSPQLISIILDAKKITAFKTELTGKLSQIGFIIKEK